MKEFVDKLIAILNKLIEQTYYEAVEGNKTAGLKNSTYHEIRKIVNQLAEEHNNDFCEWRLCDEDSNVYDTSCRNPHILLEGTPADNDYEFCPYCGKKIKVVE